MAWCHFVHGCCCCVVVLLLQCFSGLQRCNSVVIDGVSSSSSSSIMIASRALLDFKASLTSAANSRASVLPSWTNGSNPCNASQPWEGVMCSSDDVVAALRLGGRGLSGAIPRNPLARLCEAGLTVLDLSNNSLSDSVPVEALGACSSLRHLNLSYNSLSGSLAPTLFSNLSAVLRSLDLSSNLFSASIPVKLGACHSLRYLSLYNNSFSGSLPPSFFSNLSALRYLDLSYNLHLSGSLAPTLISNLSALWYLDLSFNNFSGSLPPPIWHLPALRTLNLADLSDPEGPFWPLQAPDIPEDLPFCANITELLLGGISFMSMRNPMVAFSKCKKLQSLTLLEMNLTSGTIPQDLWQLPSLKSLHLESLGAISTSSLPASMASCKNLQYLSLTNVSLARATLPPSLFVNCKKLQSLVFQGTGVQGVIPRSLWELPALVVLVLVEESNLTSQASLPPQLPSCGTISEISIQGVKLGGEIPPSLGNCYALWLLVLSGVGMSGPIPKTLGNLVGLSFLDLSNNSLSGSIPESLGNMWQLWGLHLSTNNLSGNLPQSLGNLSQLSTLDVSTNNLSGNLPQSLGNLSQLSSLDVSNNHFNGDVPTAALVACTNLGILCLHQNSLTGALDQLELWKMKNLGIFTAQQNRFHGRVTSNLTRSGGRLQLVDLGNNNLSGELPSKKESHGLQGLTVLILSNNRLDGGIPIWLWELPSLQLLELSNCHLAGVIPASIAHLPYFRRNDPTNITKTLYYVPDILIKKDEQQLLLSYLSSDRISLDLSHNSFCGPIPDSFGKLVGLTSLDLSHNSLFGPIPPSLGNLSKLDVLDLSSNALRGPIPSQLGLLGYLGTLNLSNNHLVGPIPTTNFFNTRFDASSFQGNTGLCGSPLPSPCITNTTTTTNNTTNSNDTTISSWFDDNVSLGGLVLGYILGLLGALCLLWQRNIKDRWFKQIHLF